MKKLVNDILNFLELIFFIAMGIALAFWLSYRMNESYKEKCQSENGTYIEEFYGFGKGKCIYDQD